MTKPRLMLLVLIAVGALTAGCGLPNQSATLQGGYTVSGSITDGSGSGIGNVSVAYTSASSGGSRISGVGHTDANGDWSISAPKDSTTEITPSRSGWTFSPTSRTLTGATTSADFVGTPLPISVSVTKGSQDDVAPGTKKVTLWMRDGAGPGLVTVQFWGESGSLLDTSSPFSVPTEWSGSKSWTVDTGGQDIGWVTVLVSSDGTDYNQSDKWP